MEPGPPPGLAVALQLWTVRNLIAEDLPGTLERVASIGYRAVEMAGFGNVDSARAAKALRRTGLVVPSAHVSWTRLLADVDAAVRDLQTIECPLLVVPAYPAHDLESVAAVRTLAARLTEVGRRLYASGIRMALHNEELQFAEVDGRSPWSILVSETDPTFVELQLDVFTALAAGQDPVGLLLRHGPRITSIHVCDRRDGAYVPVGEGEVDWRVLVDVAGRTACRWLIVEHEDAPEPLDAAAVSLEALGRLLGVPASRSADA